MPRLQSADEIEQFIRLYGAHNSELQRCLFELAEVESLALRLRGLRVDLLEVGLYRSAEFGQMGVGPLPVEERASELLLEQLDRTCERRLRHVAALGRPREVEFFAHREEVPDLMHLHGSLRRVRPPTRP